MKENNLPEWSQKFILALLFSGLILMAVYTTYYKLDNPFLNVQGSSSVKLSKQDKVMSMISLLMQRLENNPKDISTLKSIAQVFMDLGNWNRAINFWKKFLELKNDDLSARQSLALCYYNIGEFKQAAIELENVLLVSEHKYYAHFNLAIIYSHYLNQRDKANKHLNYLIKNLDENSDLWIKASKELKRINP